MPVPKAIEQADPGFRLKSLVAGERTPETAEQIVAAMAEAKMFVAIGKAGENDGQPVFGVAEVMAKPFTIAELRATVLKVIEGSIG